MSGWGIVKTVLIYIGAVVLFMYYKIEPSGIEMYFLILLVTCMTLLSDILEVLKGIKKELIKENEQLTAIDEITDLRDQARKFLERREKHEKN